MTFRIASLTLVVLFAGGLMGCPEVKQRRGGSSGPSVQDAPDVSAEGMAEAKVVFKTRCVACHGEQGQGDGPGAVAMNPKPRGYRDRDWQASVTNDYLAKVIVGGGTAVGKSPFMTPNPDLQAKPDVVNGLVAIVRGFSE